ncbi:MAG: hypothetical protein NDF56_05110 [archaeon GB-1845-036]|nr:hypothetical protein [Candidatus Culexmicrobium thermophilum]
MSGYNPFAFNFFGLFLGPIGLLILIVLLFLVGGLIILLIGAAIFFLPALIVAAIVWFISGSRFLAGIAFLIIALLAFLKKYGFFSLF